MWKEYNPSPLAKRTGDCAIRAVAKALDTDWETAYARLTMNGFTMAGLPNEHSVVAATLRKNGFFRAVVPNTCPDCYTAADFAEDNPEGVFVLCFGTHMATVVDGDIYDAWDSSTMIPQFVWYKKDNPPKGEDE